MKKVLKVVAVGFLVLAVVGLVASVLDPRKPDSSSTKTEQTEQQPKEEEKKAEEKPKEEAPKEEPAQQIVTEQTRYDVFRCDVKHGVLGDTVGVTNNTVDFSQDYADLSPDGSFSFSIQGVSYTTKISLGEKDHHTYSGIENYEVTRILFDGKDDITIGDVIVEGYYVDDYILLEMITQVDHKTTFMTFYLWKHVDGM